MMNRDKTGPRRYRSRTATISVCLGIIAGVCILLAPNLITSVETPVARDCAAWANQEFNSPSPARDEAFIDCIVKRDPSATPDALRHELETGDGDELYNQLMTVETPPMAPDPDCTFLRVAVQSPAGSDEVTQKPMRDLFSTELTRKGRFLTVQSVLL